MIAFKTPESLKELMSFLGLVNYFRDHIRNHSTHVHHLHDMVSVAKNQIIKMITWIAAVKIEIEFKTLKDLVNECAKLYFIKKEYKIVLCRICRLLLCRMAIYAPGLAYGFLDHTTYVFTAPSWPGKQ